MIDIFRRKLKNISYLTFMTFARSFLHILVITLLRSPFSSQQGMVKFKKFQLKQDLVKSCVHNKSSSCEILLTVCLVNADRNSPGTNCLLKSQPTPIGVNETEFNIKFPNSFGDPLNLVFKGVLKASRKIIFEERFLHPLTFLDTVWNNVSSSYTTKPFSYLLSCRENYYGGKCLVICKPNSRFTCNNDGSRLCKSGWFGRNCEDKCECGGNANGRCESSVKCECFRGWTGRFCETDMCNTITCYNGGLCKDGKCNCREGFTGNACETSVNKSTLTSVFPHTSLSNSMVTEYSISPSMSTPATTQTNRLSTTILLTATAFKETITISKLLAATTKTIMPTSSSISKVTSSKIRSNSISINSSTSAHIYTQPIHTRYNKPSTKSITATLIAPSTTWAPSSTTANITGTPQIIQHGKMRYIVLTIILPVIAGIFVVVVIIGLVMLWYEREKRQRRKSEASTISPISLGDGNFTSRPSSISTSRSITPLTKYFFERGTAVGAESSDTISSVEYPAPGHTFKPNKTYESNNYEKYTLPAIDRLCMETLIVGHKRSISGTIKPNLPDVNNSNMNRSTRTSRVTKTFSNCSRKSQTSSEYCSSGYWSGSSSPTPRPDPIISCMLPYVYQEKSVQNDRNRYNSSINTKPIFGESDGQGLLINSHITNYQGNKLNTNTTTKSDNIEIVYPDDDHIHKSSNKNNIDVDNSCLRSESNRSNNNSNNNNNERRHSSKRSSCGTVYETGNSRATSSASSEEFHHSRQVLNSVKFVDLPNYVSYKEDSL